MSPRSGLNARGSLTSPRVEQNLLGNLKFFLDSKLGAREANAETATKLMTPLLGGSWGTFSHFLSLFSLFWRSLNQHRFFYRYFSFLDRFWEDFGWIWEGFWQIFSMIFHIFLENADFVKYSVFLWKNHYFSYVGLLKNNRTPTKNR